MVATFSIVAFEPETKALGVAVQSKFLAVGAIVPWARAGVGAVATQAMANFNYGPRGLDLMSRGKTAEETVEALISSDDEREHRQLGVVDARAARRPLQGASASSGPGCGGALRRPGQHPRRARDRRGDGETFEATPGTSPGAPSCAGRRTGCGDSRGKQSAALLVVKEGSGYGGNNDRLLDLRVDDHPEPIRELIRIRSTPSTSGRPDLKTSWQWTVR